MRIIQIGWTRFAAARGITVPADDYPRAIFGRRTHEILVDYFRLEPAEADTLVAQGLDDKTEIVRQEGLTEVPGAAAFVRASHLAGLRLSLVTSASPANVRLALDALGLDGVFDVAITSADVRSGKPAPDPYLAAAERLGVEPGRAVVFEDTLIGIEAAHAAGSSCVAVATTMRRSDLASAEFVIDDFLGLDPAKVMQDLGV